MQYSYETSETTQQQMECAEQIVRNLAEDGRFAGKLWTRGATVRVYVEDYGYLAVGRDGTVYPNLRRYVGNIQRAAKV